MVREVIANNPMWSAERIYKHLTEAAEAVGLSIDAIPKPRTISRIKDRFPLETWGEYQFVRWPESYEAALVPWEAARVLLDVGAVIGGRITVRTARWYWRIWQAAPGIALLQCLDVARIAAAFEVGAGKRFAMFGDAAMFRALADSMQKNTMDIEFRRGLEAWLEARAWLDGGYARFREAAVGGRVPPWHPLYDRRRVGAWPVDPGATVELGIDSDEFERFEQEVRARMVQYDRPE